MARFGETKLSDPELFGAIDGETCVLDVRADPDVGLEVALVLLVLGLGNMFTVEDPEVFPAALDAVGEEPTG